MSTIRRAGPADAGAVSWVHTRARSARSFTDPVQRDTGEAVWRQRLEAVDAETVVAEGEDGVVVGFASVAVPGEADSPGGVEPGVAVLLALYVDPPEQGHGHGAALLTHVEDAWRARGARAMLLWVHVGNERARAFYERHGWRADPIARDDPDELRYRRDL